jgi:hypothetical protein
MLFPPIQPAYAAAITSSPLAYIVVGLCGAALIAAGIFEVVTGRRVRMRLGGSDSRVAFVRIGGAGSLLFGIFLVEQALEWHSSAQALGFPSWLRLVQIPGLVGLAVLLLAEYPNRRGSPDRGGG